MKKIVKNVELLNNRYHLLEKIASGGFSDVYNATDTYSQYFENSSNIVIKIPKDEYLAKNDIDAFFYNEYKILRELKLDTIIQVLDFGVDKFPYIVFEKIEGELFSKINFDNIHIKTKKQIYKSLKNTLSYIHKKNIVHADISPSNIFLTNSDKVVLFDFGFSFKQNKTYSFSLDYSNNQVLNPRYMSPILFEEKQKPNNQTDLFSLCIVLFEMYSNKNLFKKNSTELYDLSINKLSMKKIPLFYRGWFRNILSIWQKSN